MSLLPRAIFGALRRRIGFALVLLGVLLVTAKLSDGSKVALIAAMLVVTAGAIWLEGRGGRSPTRRRPRDGPGPFSISYRWTGRDHVDLAAISRAIVSGGGKPKIESEAPDRVVMSSGNHLKSRLLGGYFVDLKELPVRIEIVRGGDGDGCLVELCVSDRWGPIAIRDGALDDRFAVVADCIRNEVGPRLEAVGFRPLV